MDEHLRALESQVAVTGDLRAQTTLLVARARVGLIKPAWLRLAARLGDPAARLATDEAGHAPWSPSWTWWSEQGLPDRLLRLYVADVAERVLPIFEERYPQDSRPRRGIEAARRYARELATEEELVEARTEAAAATAEAAAMREREIEHMWQREHLISYLVGDVRM